MYRVVKRSEIIYHQCVCLENPCYNGRDRKIDKFLTSKATGIPVMLLLLALIFWITINGANVPSDLIAGFLLRQASGGCKQKRALYSAGIKREKVHHVIDRVAFYVTLNPRSRN